MAEAVGSRVPVAPEIRPRAKDSLMAAAVIGTHGIEHMYGRAFYVIIPDIRDALALSYLQTYLMDGIRSIASGLTSMGSGFFTDIFQHRRVQILAVSMLLVGLGYFLVALSPVYVLLLAFLLLPSIGAALWHPPALGLLSQRFPGRRGFVTALHRSTGNLGDVVAPLIVGALLVTLPALIFGRENWRWVLGAGTPMLLLLSLLIIVSLRNWGKGPRPQEAGFGRNTRAQFHSLKQVLKGGGLSAILPVFAVSAVHGMGDRALLTMIPLYISDEIKAGRFWVGSPENVGWWIGVHAALLSAGAIAVGPLIGALSDRIGRKPPIVFVMAVAFMIPLAMVFSGSSIGFTLSVVAFGFFGFSVNSLTQAAAMDMAAGRRLEGTFIGLMWGFNAFFGFATALSAGALADFAGREAVFYLASSLFFVGLLASLIMPGIRSHRMRIASAPVGGQVVPPPATSE